jgi:hypothetical protein
MTQRQRSTSLGDRVVSFLDRPNPVVFAGAGVGAHVGFPTWQVFIEGLADACDSHGDASSATAIRDRARRGRYLEAATIYSSADLIPEGERWKLLAEPFVRRLADEALDRLIPLAALPVTGIITTNYDRSLLDAWARYYQRAPVTAERGTLATCSLSREPYIARVHGIAERPTSLAFDRQSYYQLSREPDYVDFLMDTFRRRSVLFVGFSFLDPAIDHVMDIYKKNYGPSFDTLHSAIIPCGQDALASRLRALNIEILEYDPADNHIAVWRGLRDAYDRVVAREGTPRRIVARPQACTSATQRFLAFAYAQSTTRQDATPVIVLAHAGIVASILAGKGEVLATVEELVPEVASALLLSREEADPIVRSSVDRLRQKGLVLVDGATILWTGDDPSQMREDLGALANGVTDRMLVREGLAPTREECRIAACALEELLMARAWDLAAQLAGAGVTWPADLDRQVESTVARIATSYKGVRAGALSRSILSILSSPDVRESQKLSSLARVAFGVQLLLSSPRQSLLHRHALPQRIYLDSNILLPLIVCGHPLRPAYLDALQRLRDASAKGDQQLEIMVGEQFLNEVMSHRQLAKELMAELGLEDPEKLAQHIGFYSAVNTNVFVGAYSSFVGRSQEKRPFATFLSEVAPYDDEMALAEFLKRGGIHTTEMRSTERNPLRFEAIRSALESAYEDADEVALHGRAKVLLLHEVQQFARLSEDVNAGMRSVFVTAHSKLRKLLRSNDRLREFVGLTTSHLGLVALAEVFGGYAIDARAMARLLWATPSSQNEHMLFNYFVDIALRQYEGALGLDIAKVAQAVAEEAKRSAEREGLRLFGDSTEDVARTARFLDRFQERFYELCKNELAKRTRR